MYLTRPGSELALRTGVFDPTWLDPVAESTVAPATGSSQVGSNTNSYKLVLKPVDIEFIITFMNTSICRDVETAGVPDPGQMSQVRPNTLEAVLRKWAKCTESLGQPKYQFFLTQDWVSVLCPDHRV